MKFVGFELNGARRLGVLTGTEIIDLGAVPGPLAMNEAFTDLRAFIAAGAPALEAARRIVANPPDLARLAATETRLLAPILPSTILCAGSNYIEHNSEKIGTPLSGTEPEFFVKTADCVVGPTDGIVYDPRLTQKLDCETELAIVIGKPGRHITVDDALDHVFGYTIVNDVTARDRQVRTSDKGFTWYELGRGKAFDTSAPLGPVVVTADEIADPQNLGIRTRINGELRQSSSTAHMIWSCAELVHFFSINFELRPGMVIITGTPAGTAWSNDPELGGRWKPQPGLVAATRYCLPGDQIECEIDRIGTLVNSVITLDESQLFRPAIGAV